MSHFEEVVEIAEKELLAFQRRFEEKHPEFKGKTFLACKAMFAAKNNPIGYVLVLRVKDIPKCFNCGEAVR